MKKICVAVAALHLSSCAYHKDGAGWGQTWNDFNGCNREAGKQANALESQCMAKLGYRDDLARPVK